MKRYRELCVIVVGIAAFVHLAQQPTSALSRFNLSVERWRGPQFSLALVEPGHWSLHSKGGQALLLVKIEMDGQETAQLNRQLEEAGLWRLQSTSASKQSAGLYHLQAAGAGRTIDVHFEEGANPEFMAALKRSSLGERISELETAYREEHLRRWTNRDIELGRPAADRAVAQLSKAFPNSKFTRLTDHSLTVQAPAEELDDIVRRCP